MINVDAYAGSIIFHLYNEKVELNNPILFKKLEDIIDIIKIRSINRGVMYTSKSLHAELFDLRIQLVNHLLSNSDLLDVLSSRILAEIGNKYFSKGPNKELGHLISDALEINYNILESIRQQQGDQFQSNLKAASTAELPTWGSHKISLSQMPALQYNTSISWFESSLDFDYCLILAELLFKNQISGSEQLSVELFGLLNESIVKMGAFAALFNLWQPPLLDDSQLIRNIKIKAAALRLEAGQGKIHSDEQLKSLLSN